MSQGNKLIDLLGGRKFAAALLALALGTAVELLKDGGLGEAYVMLLVGTVGVFSGANALVSWRGLQVGHGEAPQPEPPPQEPIEDLLKHDDRILALESEVAKQAEAIAKATQLIGALIQQQQR